MNIHFKQIINKYKSSRDAKTVVKNAGYLVLLQVAGYIFPLLTMPYLARVIGPEGFGKISFAAATIIWFQTVADWGFNFTATRDVAQNRNDKDKVSEIFSNVFWARCLLCVISFLFLLLLIMFIPLFRENAAILIVTYLMIPGHILFPDWFFQAVERMKFTTYFNLCIKVIFTIAVFVFVKEKDDYILQPLLTTLGFVICGICALYLILFKWGYKLYRPNPKAVYSAIKGSSDVFINNLFPNLYNSLSVVLLGFWGGPTANGLYDGGNKFITIVNNFQHVLSRAFYPFLARRKEKHSLYAKINMSSAIILCLGLSLFAPFIVKIMLSEEFAESTIVLQIMSISLIGMALNNTYGTNFLIVRHHESLLRKITIRTSIIGLLIAFPLVYYFTYIGAAITITSTRLLLGGQACFEALRIKKK